MDFKKILANFDTVENNTGTKALETKKAAGSMLAILESFDRVNEGEKPDFADIDNDGDKEESMSDAEKDKEEIDEAIMVSAEGDEAAQLLSILQLAGMPAPAPMPAIEPEIAPTDSSIEMQDDYANTPDEFEQDVDSVISNGSDLHSEKDQFAAAEPGDNPMRAFEGKFKSILDELLKES